ncbi:hypothetical protein TNCV_2380751 [Trichonephila clavipes]|nr:hypothetical protein TNCV_2380751 [Trichonephila clavipes]
MEDVLHGMWSPHSAKNTAYLFSMEALGIKEYSSILISAISKSQIGRSRYNLSSKVYTKYALLDLGQKSMYAVLFQI